MLQEKMDSFLRPDLRHSASTLTDLKEMKTIGSVVELYELLLHLSEETKISCAQFLPTAYRLSEEFNKYALAPTWGIG